MAKAASKSDRTDPTANKSLAIRNVLKKMPAASFADVSNAVKEEYGHDVKSSLFYMLKAKGNMKASRKAKAANGQPAKAAASPMNSAASWVEAIKLARQLLKASGSVDNATALLNAVEG